MTILKITNFGGELPRVSPRALRADAAQVNSNLLATSSEFRPLLGDSVIGTAPAGAKTLYRLSRDASGNLRTDPASGWIAETVSKNYVKGQINDDATERTYVSFNDGSAPPRAIDALGADRQLGVPAPTSLTPKVNQGKFFTQKDADVYQSTTLYPALLSAARAVLVESDPAGRMYAGAGETVAGPLTLHGLTWWDGVTPNDYHNLRYTVPLAAGTAAGLADPRITPQTVGGTLVIRISCVPLWGRVADAEPFKAALRLITNPTAAGERLFSDQVVNVLSDDLVAKFDPRGASLTSQRNLLDNTVSEFKKAVEFVLTPNAGAVGVGATAPVAPVKPTSPTYMSSGGDTDSISYAPEWAAYDAAVVTYNAALAKFKGGETINTNEKSARISEIVTLQSQALRVTKEIEAAYLERRNGLAAWIDQVMGGYNGDFNGTDEPTGNILKVDAEPVKETRFYFATYTTDWGEESAPSPVTALLEVDQYSDVTLTLPAPPSGRNVVATNLYRSNVGTTSAGFQFVKAIPVATTSFIDKLKAAELGESCPTITWAEPPAGLRGLVGLPNGIMAGFVDNYVAFCDPYHPYAWPVEYQVTMEHPIVGLGVFGQSLVVGTQANPSIVSGSDSASMSAQVLDDAQACVSARSMVSAGGGVLFASPDGLCFASQNGVELITAALFAREDWQALQPESIIAAMHEGVYYFWFAGSGTRPAGCYALDLVAKKLVRVEATATAVFADSLTDALFYVDGGQLKRAFSAGRRSGRWKSAKMEIEAQTPLAWGKVMGDQTQDNPVTLVWTGDGAERYTKTVTDTQPWRLPPGRYLEHEVQVSGAARVTKVFLSSTTDELKGIS